MSTVFIKGLISISVLFRPTDSFESYFQKVPQWGGGGVRENGGERGLEMKEMQLEVGEGPLDDEDLTQVLDPFARSFLIHISFQVRMLFEWESPGVVEGVDFGTSR